MGRYWRIYKSFARSSFQRELEFRANFFAKIGQNVIWTFFFIVVLVVIFSQTSSVAGWNQGQSFMLAGTIFVLDSVIRSFFFSLLEIPEQVRKGTLDFVVTKPVDTQFWISTRKFDFGQIGALVTGFGVVGYGVYTAGVNPSAIDWMGYFVLLLSSILIFYGATLMMMTLAIWFVRVDNLWVLSDTMMGVARFPIDIYGTWIQRIFTYAVPLAFLAYFPAAQLRNGISPLHVVMGLVWAATIFFGARTFWKVALRSYGSASS